MIGYFYVNISSSTEGNLKIELVFCCRNLILCINPPSLRLAHYIPTLVMVIPDWLPTPKPFGNPTSNHRNSILVRYLDCDCIFAHYSDELDIFYCLFTPNTVQKYVLIWHIWIAETTFNLYTWHAQYSDPLNPTHVQL